MIHPFVYYAINEIGKETNLRVVVLVLKGLLGFYKNLVPKYSNIRYYLLD